jgi:hypothetical protein
VWFNQKARSRAGLTATIDHEVSRLSEIGRILGPASPRGVRGG